MPVNPHTDSHRQPAPARRQGCNRLERPRLLRRFAAQAVAISACLLGLMSAGHAAPAQPAAPSTAAETQTTLRLNVPDVPVLDQNGKRRSFYKDLVAGRSVAINFIFTSCTSICSPLSATFKAMQTEVARKAGGDVHFISVSVDPLSDTPQELNKFAKKFEAGPGWTFVTGSRASIDAILKAYDVSAGDPNDHSPMIYLGHEPSKRWVRTYGLASPQQLVERLTGLSKVAAADDKAGAKVAATVNNTPELGAMRQIAAQQASRASVVSAASGTRGADYFTNLPLMTQDRPRVRFYDDLIRNRVVLITSFYSSCKDVCSPVSFNLAKVQEMLAQEVDTPVQLISISTDSGIDTPEVLRDFARRHNAQPGWSFVTGKPENVNWVLHKLGMYNDKPEQHSAVLWVGNDRTGAWLKLHALAPPQAILEAVRKVL